MTASGDLPRDSNARMRAIPRAQSATRSQSRKTARSRKTNTPTNSTHICAVLCSQMALAAVPVAMAER